MPLSYPLTLSRSHTHEHVRGTDAKHAYTFTCIGPMPQGIKLPGNLPEQSVVAISNGSLREEHGVKQW